MGGYYHTATICLNGHEISAYKAECQPYCELCGAKTTSYCSFCNKPIRGEYEAEGIVAIGFKYYKPYYCWNCGKPYPWTEKIIKNAIEIMSLDESLGDPERELIKNAIPNLIVDTPDTPIAVAKYKKGISQAAEFVKASMRQLLVDVVSETIRKALFP